MRNDYALGGGSLVEELDYNYKGDPLQNQGKGEDVKVSFCRRGSCCLGVNHANTTYKRI